MFIPKGRKSVLLRVIGVLGVNIVFDAISERNIFVLLGFLGNGDDEFSAICPLLFLNGGRNIDFFSFALIIRPAPSWRRPCPDWSGSY